MKIAFITDLHLGDEGVNPTGVDVRQNFLNALAVLRTMKPDGLVVGGDVCYETADRAVYAWTKAQLDELPFPYYVIPGNHDDSALLAEVFNLTHHLHGSELYYALPFEGYPVLFLDTARGELSDRQWAWLRDYMAALRNSNVLVFSHFPTVPADVQFMDTHFPFRQSAEFIQLVKDLPCHVTVVCGHYHVARTVQRGNLLTLLSPSTFYQMRPDTDQFTPDHYRVGIREISLTTNGLSSTVHWLD